MTDCLVDIGHRNAATVCRRAPPKQPDPDSGQLRWIRARWSRSTATTHVFTVMRTTKRAPRIRGAAWVSRPQSSKVSRFVAKRARIRPKCDRKRTYFPGYAPKSLIPSDLLWAFFCTGTLNRSNGLSWEYDFTRLRMSTSRTRCGPRKDRRPHRVLKPSREHASPESRDREDRSRRRPPPTTAAPARPSPRSARGAAELVRSWGLRSLLCELMCYRPASCNRACTGCLREGGRVDDWRGGGRRRG